MPLLLTKRKKPGNSCRYSESAWSTSDGQASSFICSGSTFNGPQGPFFLPARDCLKIPGSVGLPHLHSVLTDSSSGFLTTHSLLLIPYYSFLTTHSYVTSRGGLDDQRWQTAIRVDFTDF